MWFLFFLNFTTISVFFPSILMVTWDIKIFYYDKIKMLIKLNNKWNWHLLIKRWRELWWTGSSRLCIKQLVASWILKIVAQECGLVDPENFCYSRISCSALKEVRNFKSLKISNYLIFICLLLSSPLPILQWKFFKENLFRGCKQSMDL